MSYEEPSPTPQEPSPSQGPTPQEPATKEDTENTFVNLNLVVTLNAVTLLGFDNSKNNIKIEVKNGNQNVDDWSLYSLRFNDETNTLIDLNLSNPIQINYPLLSAQFTSEQTPFYEIIRGTNIIKSDTLSLPSPDVYVINNTEVLLNSVDIYYLENKIDITIQSNPIFPSLNSLYSLKFNSDNKIYPLKNYTSLSIQNMSLLQLKNDILLSYVIYRNTTTIKQSTITLSNQNKNYNYFKLTPITRRDSSFLYNQFDKYIYLDNVKNAVYFTFDKTKIDPSLVDYSVKISGGTELIIDLNKTNQYVIFSIGTTVTKKLELKINKKYNDDYVVFETSDFILHQCNFDKFNDFVINPISNINYFNTKHLKFYITNDYISIIDMHSKTYTTENIKKIVDFYYSTEKDTIVLNNVQELNEITIENIDEYNNIVHGQNSFTFQTKNILKGKSTILSDATDEEQEVLSKSKTILLNIDLKSLISCKIQ